MLTLVFLLLSFLLLPGLAVAQNVTYKFTLTWDDNSTDEQGFKIYRDGKEIAKVGKDVKTYFDTITGPAKTQYCWEVTAYAASESAKSNRACMALPDAPVIKPPAVPSGLTVTMESVTAIRMSWQNNSTNETGFEIRRTTGQPPLTTIIDKIPAGTTLFIDEGLVALTTYCYQVRAVNSGGVSAYSVQSCGTTLAK